jgi:ribonuclease HII
LAGPIVAAAVIFKNFNEIQDKLTRIDDSKKLTAKNRQEIDQIVRDYAFDLAIGEVSVTEIDQYGIGAANVIAFKRAIDKLKRCNFALIDGRRFRGFERPYRCIEKGESKSISIAAASIIAKVHRDALMEKIGHDFPNYDFIANKGYASDKHCDALRNLGPTPHHRKSFLKWLDQEKNSQSLF